jgi:hypothetical protein
MTHAKENIDPVLLGLMLKNTAPFGMSPKLEERDYNDNENKNVTLRQRIACAS